MFIWIIFERAYGAAPKVQLLLDKIATLRLQLVLHKLTDMKAVLRTSQLRKGDGSIHVRRCIAMSSQTEQFFDLNFVGNPLWHAAGYRWVFLCAVQALHHRSLRKILLFKAVVQLLLPLLIDNLLFVLQFLGQSTFTMGLGCCSSIPSWHIPRRIVAVDQFNLMIEHLLIVNFHPFFFPLRCFKTSAVPSVFTWLDMLVRIGRPFAFDILQNLPLNELVLVIGHTFKY